MRTLSEIARAEFSEQFEGLSDMDFGYNPVTKQYDVPMIEWDGPYGRHWSRYESEEARTEALERYSSHRESWILSRIKELEKVVEERIRQREMTDNTIGNLFPNLKNLIPQY